MSASMANDSWDSPLSTLTFLRCFPNCTNSFLSLTLVTYGKVRNRKNDQAGNIPELKVKQLRIRQLISAAASNLIGIEFAAINEVVLNQGACTNLEITRCQLGSLTATNTTQNTKISGGTVDQIKFSKNFTSFRLQKTENDPAEDCRIAVMDLCNTAGEVDFKSSTISKLFLDGFTSGKDSKFQHVTVTDSLFMQSSSFENARFHNVNFSNASIRLLNSSLSGCELINVEWPRNYELYEYSRDLNGKNTREILNVLWPMKECYRQLKVLSLDQHNKIDALSFQMHELKIYWKIVDIKFWNDFKWRDVGNWVVLGTNRLFSDFGQSFGRPLLWLLIVHSLLFYLLITTFNLGIRPEPNFSLWSSDAFIAGLGMYLNLISPVHSSEITNQLTSDAIPIFGSIDFLMRFFNGLFIYYIIRASRKFNTSL